MFFTQEDYKKIANALRQLAVKDSDFNTVSSFTGEETVVIVQNNENKNIKLKNLVGSGSILEYPTINDFPDTGNKKTIYIDDSTSIIYRWDDNQYKDLNNFNDSIVDIENKIEIIEEQLSELPDTVASKEELKAVEDKIDRKVIDLNQQVTGVGKDVADKASISDLEELRDYVSDRLSPVGSDVRPIYFNDKGVPDTIDGLVLPDSIQSLNGGISAKGIADFGSGSGGGSQVSITQKVNSGNAIADVVIDGETTTLYAPIVDLSGKVDKEPGKGLSSNDFTDQEKDKLARLENYDDTAIWREVNKKVDKDNLKDKGNDLKPVFFDADAVAHEIRGVRVPDSIESLEGGVSAKGIADFGISSGNGGGSQVKVTPLVSDGQAIAQIEVDGKQNTLYAPNPNISSKVDKTEFNTYKQEVAEDVAQLSQDINTEANTRRAKDQELTTSIKTLQDLFTEDGAAKNANKLDGKSIEELFDNLDANGGINITIGGVEKTLTKSELLAMLGFVNTGKHNLPVYYEDEQMKEIDSLSVFGNIESTNGGVSARGISDFGTPSGAGGASGLDVLRDDELEDVNSESVTQVASAWSVKRIKDIANIDDIPVFNSSLSYDRGDYVRYNNIAWKFIGNHQGEWDSGHCKRVDINDILTPSNVYVEDLINKYFR